MKLIVGLGNPGSSYAGHRHNVGFMALDAIASRHGLPAWRKRFQGLATEGDLGGERCLLLKPQTYMNESGRAVGEAARFHKIEPAGIIVLHDEIDLAPGKLKVKTGGGNAGHNGLRSITAHVGNDYVRVRIGIGHPGAKELVHHWVLHDFAKADEAWLAPLLEAIADSIGLLASGDDARFLSEVARATRPKSEKADAPEKAAKPAKAVKSDTAEGAPGRPPPELPATALAEKLKRWLGR